MSAPLIQKELVESISKKLVFIWSDAQKSDEHLKNLEHPPSKLHLTSDGYFVVRKKGIKGFDDVHTILKENIDKFDEKFSKKYVEKLVEDSILSLLKFDHTEVFEKADIEAQKIIDTLTAPLNDYILKVPITNFNLDIDLLQIGKVKFFKFVEPEFEPTDKDQIKRLRETLSNDIFPKFKNLIISQVSVKALDDEKAENLGLELVEEALDVIRFYALNLKFRQSYFLRNYFDIRGRIQSDITPVLLSKPSVTKELSPSLSRAGYLYGFDFTTEFYNEMLKNGLDAVNEILNIHPNLRKEFENRIISAIRLAGSSFMNVEEYKTFLNYMISLEALLLHKRESKKDNLSERVTLIIADNLKDRNQVYDLMGNLYEIRSKIVHEGYKDVSRSDMIQLQHYTFLCLTIMLKIYKTENIEIINDLINWIRNIKFSGKR